MNKVILSVALSAISFFSFAQPSAQFSTDKFENFTLHTYASFDPMADVSFIVETDKKLVVIEPQVFTNNIEEFVQYTQQLGKPIEKVLVSFHALGLKVYENEDKVIPRPMEAFMQSEAAKGMIEFFGKKYNNSIDTEVVKFDEVVEATTMFNVDGVSYRLEPTSMPGMPGVNIAIDDKVYYQHFSPSKEFHASYHMIKKKASIDGALMDLAKAKQAGYTLLLGSHGFGKATAADLDFQITYFKKMKQLVADSADAEIFVKNMNTEYPDLQGQEDLTIIAKNLYQ
ncbi:hypothetical protein ABIS04_17145 [Shewanella sp. H8]|uniref:hypothetical protein n=1 Tax=Shewanella sp. H8 TaxID=3342676 RepID=UPI00331472BA